MSAEEIAETLINGNITDARNAIVKGHTPKQAAVMTLDVLGFLTDHLDHYSDGENYAAATARLRRCIDPHGEC